MDVQSGSKSVLKSKTLNVNSATTLTGIIALVAGSDMIQANPTAAIWATALLPVANIILRFYTGKPIGEDKFVRADVPKEFYRSSAFWMNIAFLSITVIGALLPTDLIKAYPQIVPAFVAVQSLANWLVRYARTGGPLNPVVETLENLFLG